MYNNQLEFERFKELWPHYSPMALPVWYTQGLHDQIMVMFTNGDKLKGVKLINEVGKEHYKKIEDEHGPLLNHEPWEGKFALREAKIDIADKLLVLIKYDTIAREAYLQELNTIINIKTDVMNLDQFKAIAGTTLPSWYGISMHLEVVKLLIENKKLQACKLLADQSKEFGTYNTFGLNWAKNEVADVIERHLEHTPAQELVDEVGYLITCQLKEDSDTSDLRHLLQFVPKRELLKYLAVNKPEAKINS